MDFRGWIDARGADEVSRVTGAPVGTVRVWRHRNRVPRNAWPDILIKMSDVTVADLRDMEDAAS